MSESRVLGAAQAAGQFRRMLEEAGTEEVAVVRNLAFVETPYEFYPLAPKTPLPLERIEAVAMDMDGTSTTTEPLALKALEEMVRRVMGRPAKSDWLGLDETLDHPHIIGSSNYRHTEFLLKRYGADIRPGAFLDGFLEAARWTLANSPDPARRQEVLQDAKNLGLAAFLEGEAPARSPEMDWDRVPFSVKVAAALDIYYRSYHGMLLDIGQGRGRELAKAFFGDENALLIGPMPGLAAYLMLVKGWLGADAGDVFPELWEEVRDSAQISREEAGKRFRKLALHFEGHPVRLALATSSLFYEADTVMREVFRVMAGQVAVCGLPGAKKERLLSKFARYQNVFDAFVTATDASEARLKPHRDIYAMTLFRMGVPKEGYRRCLAFEDTRPGILGARAAGYGVSVGMPNRDTARQGFAEASCVVPGGLPEVLLVRNHFLKL